MIVLLTKTADSAMEDCLHFHNRKVLQSIGQPKERPGKWTAWIQLVIGLRELEIYKKIFKNNI